MMLHFHKNPRLQLSSLKKKKKKRAEPLLHALQFRAMFTKVTHQARREDGAGRLFGPGPCTLEGPHFASASRYYYLIFEFDCELS